MRALSFLVGLSALLLVAVACGGEASPAPVSDGRPGGIEGTVTTPDGAPVAGVRVGIVSGTAPFPEVGPQTDAKGYYHIGGVPPGTFQVAFHDTQGERIALESVEVRSGETSTLNFSVSAGPEPLAAVPSSDKEPTDGLCLPPAALGVSIGDTWTISGPVNLPEGFPIELPVGAAEASRTFTVDAIGTTTYGGRGDAPIEHPTIQLKVTNVTRDVDGNVLSAEDDPRAARGGWTPASVTDLGPALTPDWECHKKAWLNGWPPPAQPSIGERVLSSGVTLVVFTVRQPLLLPDQGIDATTEAHHGYDRVTGRVVLQEAHHTGTRNGAPFNMDMLAELVPTGTGSPAATPASSPTPKAPPAPGAPPPDCQEYLGLLVSVDRTQEPAVVTYYQCVRGYVDSTGQYPSRSPSLVVPSGSPVDLRLEAATQPTAVEVRLYPEAGLYGSFGQWPERLQTGIEAVDVIRPEPSLSFQYLPQQPAGQYSLVVRATWEGPVDVFYAKSFRLE